MAKPRVEARTLITEHAGEPCRHKYQHTFHDREAAEPALTRQNRRSAEDQALIRLHRDIAPVLVPDHRRVLPRLHQHVVQRPNAPDLLRRAAASPNGRSSAHPE